MKAQIERVVLWGHKIHSHTHSYIHKGLEIAFQHLGYKVLWFDSKDVIENLDLEKSLFITEGQVDAAIPLLPNSYYVLHNCDLTKYQAALKSHQYLVWQVFTKDVLDRKGCVCVGPAQYVDVKNRTFYSPWATDFLPGEIEQRKKIIQEGKILGQNTCVWVGTIGGGQFGNQDQIQPFQDMCRRNKIDFVLGEPGLSRDENSQLIVQSRFAPAIVGTWQQEHGYIPCRIFKNISYGKFGITNSQEVFDLFQKKIIYHESSTQLAELALQSHPNQEQLFEIMDIVKEEHTFIQRINQIFHFFDLLPLK